MIRVNFIFFFMLSLIGFIKVGLALDIYNPPCVILYSAKVLVNPSTTDVVYNYSKSKDELSKISARQYKSVNTRYVNRYSGSSSKVNIDIGTKFTGFLYDNKDVCMWVDTVTVNLVISPTVFIAKDYPPGSCTFNAIMDQEKKHNINERKMVNNHAQSLGDALQRELIKQSAQGPLTPEARKQKEKESKAQLVAIVQTQMAQFSEKMKQIEIDERLADPDRITALCGRQPRR